MNIEFYSAEQKHPELFNKKYIEYLNLIKQINNYSLSELEALINHYTEKLDKVFILQSLSAPISEKDKQERFKEVHSLLYLLEDLRSIWNRKFNELNNAEKLAHLKAVKSSKRG